MYNLCFSPLNIHEMHYKGTAKDGHIPVRAAWVGFLAKTVCNFSSSELVFFPLKNATTLVFKEMDKYPCGNFYYSDK